MKYSVANFLTSPIIEILPTGQTNGSRLWRPCIHFNGMKGSCGRFASGANVFRVKTGVSVARGEVL